MNDEEFWTLREVYSKDVKTAEDFTAFQEAIGLDKYKAFLLRLAEEMQKENQTRGNKPNQIRGPKQ